MNPEAGAIEIRINPLDPGYLAKVWFEVAIGQAGWGSLFFGVSRGTRAIEPTVRITICNAFDPLQDLAAFAEQACISQEPLSLLIDSEGPLTEFTLRDGPTSAIFAVHDYVRPAVLFAAEVDRHELGLSLAYALRRTIDAPTKGEAWREWFYLDEDPEADVDPHFFDNEWLRELVFASHPLGGDMVDGADTWNGDRFRQCLPENS